jgi:hypothetical protein
VVPDRGTFVSAMRRWVMLWGERHTRGRDIR